MAQERDPEDLRMMVIVLRSLHKWTQRDLAEASGIQPSTISDFERGTRVPGRAALERIAEAAGLSSSLLAQLLTTLRVVRIAAQGQLGRRPRWEEELVLAMSDAAGEVARVANELLGEWEPRVQPPSPADREKVPDLWERLARQSVRMRRVLVEEAPEMRSWALCEKLCEESSKALAENVTEAVELVTLALRLAERIPGQEAWRLRVQGYVWAFAADAFRMAGDVAQADEALVRSRRLWMAGAPGNPGLLDGRLRPGLHGGGAELPS